MTDLQLILKKFNAIDERFDQIDKRLDSHDKRFDNLDKKIDHMNKNLNQVSGKVDEILKFVSVSPENKKTLEKINKITARSKKVSPIL